MEIISLQRGFSYKACLKTRAGISLRDLSEYGKIVLNHRCCGSNQYNIPDRMMQLCSNTTLNQNYVVFLTLLKIKYESRNQYH